MLHKKGSGSSFSDPQARASQRFRGQGLASPRCQGAHLMCLRPGTRRFSARIQTPNVLAPYGQKRHQFSGHYRDTIAPPWACPVARILCSTRATHCQGRHAPYQSTGMEYAENCGSCVTTVKPSCCAWAMEEAIEGIPVVQGKALQGRDSPRQLCRFSVL